MHHAKDSKLLNQFLDLRRLLLHQTLVILFLCSIGSAATIFSDNFTNGASPLWGNESGNWISSGGVYLASVPNRAPQAASLLPLQLSDFTVDVDVNGASDGGIWLRSNTARTAGVLLVVGGRTHTGTGLYWHIAPDYSTILSPSAALFKQGDNLHVRVTVRGNTYSAYLNGSMIPATTLVTNSVPSGMVGLYDFTGHVFGNQSFDNFVVTSSAIVTDRCGGFSSQPTNPTCSTRLGSVCLQFSDGFLWQSQADAVLSWDTFTCPGPVTVEAAYASTPGMGYSAFLHQLGTNLVKVAPVNSTGPGVQHDFDGNGVPDLVWQNESTRQVAVDYYGGAGGATLLGWNWLYPGLGAAGWHVRAPLHH